MHQRGAASLHLATWVAMLKPLRAVDRPASTARRQVYRRKTMDLGEAPCQELKVFFMVLI